jgi:sugar (pentulose or hexulose) kinase
MAIAVDSTSSGRSPSGTSAHSWDHTCSGSDRLLIVGIMAPPDSGSYNVTNVTYNGVSMTKLGTQIKVSGGTADWWISLYGLLAPATGTNTVSFTSSNSLAACAVSYTGVSQSGLPDSSNQANSGGSNVSTFTLSTTVSASNCWLVAAFRGFNQETVIWNGGAGTTKRVGSLGGTNPYFHIIDSNGTVGTGSQSLIMDRSSGSERCGGVIISIAPASAPPTNNAGFMAWYN